MHRHMWRIVRRKYTSMYKFVCGCGETRLKYKYGFWLPMEVASKFDTDDYAKEY